MGGNIKTYIEDYSRKAIDDPKMQLYKFYLCDGYLNMFLSINPESILPSARATYSNKTFIYVDRLCNYTKIGSYDDYKNHVFDFGQNVEYDSNGTLIQFDSFDIRHLETNAVVVYIISYQEMLNENSELIPDENSFNITEFFAYDVKLDIKLTEMLDDYCAICQDLNRVHMISAALLRWNLLKSFQNLNDINNCIEIYNDLTRIVNQDDDCTRCCRINSCNKDCTNPCNVCINGSCSIN